MWNHISISFGDNVKVRSPPKTEALEVAGCVGQVCGETVPSVTDIPVVGSPGDEDRAVNVHFDGFNNSFWFAPKILEFVDHAEGTEIRLDGVPKRWTRKADGVWVESRQKKPWWKLW